MKIQLPKLKFSEMARGFFLASFNPGVWNQDSGDTTEDNADLRRNQGKPWEGFFFFPTKQHMAVVVLILC